MRPKAVVFDIGNVLVTWSPERFYDQLMPQAAREALFARVDLHGMNNRVDRGAPWRETVYEMAQQFPDDAALIRLWHDRWIEMASPLIAHSWRLLRALKAKRVPVFALSNFGRESFAYARTVYPELDEFDRRFISGHMGVIKPEPEIYARVEAETGLSGVELFFIDDRVENIVAARGRGWQGHVFETAAKLAAALVQMGLLSEIQSR